MGPPGIGKTQIMEQAARECGVNLVSYTITHHTRQSAIGLPFIKEKSYGGETRSVTEYTMSEIIASVYDKMEATGIRRGSCLLMRSTAFRRLWLPPCSSSSSARLSETSRCLPAGSLWAAGNPPEYNKSVRDFDVVTLDRVKKIDVREDFGVWKEYAL